MKASVERVKVHLQKIEVIQNEFRLLELKDRSLAESNFERVNFWSFIYLILFIMVGVFQVSYLDWRIEFR
jgi:protein ERP2